MSEEARTITNDRLRTLLNGAWLQRATAAASASNLCVVQLQFELDGVDMTARFVATLEQWAAIKACDGPAPVELQLDDQTAPKP